MRKEETDIFSTLRSLMGLGEAGQMMQHRQQMLLQQPQEFDLRQRLGEAQLRGQEGQNEADPERLRKLKLDVAYQEMLNQQLPIAFASQQAAQEQANEAAKFQNSQNPYVAAKNRFEVGHMVSDQAINELLKRAQIASAGSQALGMANVDPEVLQQIIYRLMNMQVPHKLTRQEEIRRDNPALAQVYDKLQQGK